MNNNETRNKKLLEAYKTAHPDLRNQVLFKKAQGEWDRVKGSPQNYENLLISLKARPAKQNLCNQNGGQKHLQQSQEKVKVTLLELFSFASFGERDPKD